jgi:hypothetical protein
LYAAARKIGCYLEEAIITDVPGGPNGSQRGIIADFSLGKVAFSDRVQNPEQEQIDRAFQEMTFGFGSDEFLDARNRVQRNIEEGRMAFDDGDEEDKLQ